MQNPHGMCCHDHDCGDADCGLAWSLYKHIDIDRVRCMNERTAGSVRNVFKPWPQRTEPSSPPLQSNEDDPELLLHVPFDGSVKLKAICIIGGDEGTHPANLKVFINRDDIDFQAAQEMAPTQQWDLNEDFNGVLEYQTQITKFNGVYSIDLYIDSNFGADSTTIHFIGFKGEFTERRREAVQAVYELKPMADSSKVPGTQGNISNLGM